MVCFDDEGGFGLSDLDVDRELPLYGGLAHSGRRSGAIFGTRFANRIERRLNEMTSRSTAFGRVSVSVFPMRKRNRHERLTQVVWPFRVPREWVRWRRIDLRG